MKRWGWLGEQRAEFLGEYLSGLAEDSSINTVVVLGDLFDDWVVPPQFEPGGNDGSPDALLELISEASQNQPIKRGFRKIVSEGKELHYVRGNHDMFLTDELLQRWIPGIICEPDEDGPGTGAYIVDDLIRAEHGCAYCLTNAPYKDGRQYRYPLGYYMARIDAYDHAVNGNGANFLQIIKDMVGHLGGDELLGELILKVAKSAEMAPNSFFVMNDNYPRSITVEAVAQQFMDWYREWDRRRYPVKALAARRAEMYGLESAMHDLWLEPKKTRIAICGHTHLTRLTGYPRNNDDKDRPSHSIYANTGTWIDNGGKYPTCVEVDVSLEQNRVDVRTVRLFKSRPPKVLAAKFVMIEDDS